jgi:hypothetical protein
MENKKKIVVLTDKQKAARSANLAKGRAKRAEMSKQKQEMKEQKHDEREEDEESDQSSDDEDLIVSKRKSVKKKIQVEDDANTLKKEFSELKSMVYDLATITRKTNKIMKQNSKQVEGSKSTNIYNVLPNKTKERKQEDEEKTPKTESYNDSLMNALRKSLM